MISHSFCQARWLFSEPTVKCCKLQTPHLCSKLLQAVSLSSLYHPIRIDPKHQFFGGAKKKPCRSSSRPTLENVQCWKWNPTALWKMWRNRSGRRKVYHLNSSSYGLLGSLVKTWWNIPGFLWENESGIHLKYLHVPIDLMKNQPWKCGKMHHSTWIRWEMRWEIGMSCCFRYDISQWLPPLPWCRLLPTASVMKSTVIQLRVENVGWLDHRSGVFCW